MASFIEAILRAKVAQICSHVGYNAITSDSTNILVDIYRRSIIHLARHCKEAANNNRRIEPTIADLIQAYDFVGISIPELQEHIQSVRLPFEKEISRDESRPSNRIQRDLLVDDLLEAKKNINSTEHDEDGENKLTVDERGAEEEEMPSVPLLRDVYQEIANQFPSPSTPIKADKLRIKREEKPAIPRLKITPLDPAVAEPPSFLPLLEGSTDDRSIPITIKTSQTPPIEKKRGPKAKANAKITKAKAKPKTKLKTKLKTKSKEKKTKTKNAPAVAVASIEAPPLIEALAPSPCPSPVAPTPPQLKPPTPHLEPSPSIRTPAPPEISMTKTPTPPVQSTSSAKQSIKGKKKKRKSNNQFAIVTESVKVETDETEWLCPMCNGPDNGDLMLQCEGRCELWFHLKCTGLKKEPKEDEHWECNNCSKPKSKPKQLVIGKQSSKVSKKSDKTSDDLQVKAEARIATPQPSTPTVIEQHTPTPPPQIIRPPVKQQSHDEPQPTRMTVVCGSSDDLCPECQLPDDGTLMIQCDDPFCAKWFHGKCVNVLSAPEDNDSWFCKVCVEKQQSAFKRRRRVK